MRCADRRRLVTILGSGVARLSSPESVSASSAFSTACSYSWLARCTRAISAFASAKRTRDDDDSDTSYSASTPVQTTLRADSACAYSPMRSANKAERCSNDSSRRSNRLRVYCFFVNVEDDVEISNPCLNKARASDGSP